MLAVTSNGSATGAYNDNDFLAGDVLVHTNNSGAPTAITWTAPGAGSIVLNSSVWYAHSIVSRSDEIMALLNATTLGSATVTNGITRANQLALAGGTYTVAAGDVLTFDFSKTAGQQFGSLVGIAATIDFTPRATGVPEPASWALMIAGFAMAGAGVRRRATLPRVAA
ncbi:MAG: PEPxxWA-CTERM sorting domain-containing protein [Proteobacteria bacterium]|nr:PEPxxWA-CTERM sorting domain-containing protein [Pseudomonadota bacterium]